MCVPAASAFADGTVVISEDGPPLTVPDNALANPFPAVLNIEGGTGPIVDVDDQQGGGSNRISWGLTITTAATSDLVIPGSGTKGIASPYPSVKNISTPTGEVITDVDVQTAISHSFPDDIDMALQGPAGQTV